MRKSYLVRVQTNRTALTWALLLQACIAGCGARPGANGPPPPPDVSVAQVIDRKIVQWDEFNGRVAATDTVEIRPRVAGYIERIAFSEGHEVRQGDLLLLIDQRPYRAELDRATADLARARTRAAFAQAQVTRADHLLASHAISDEEHDERLAAAGEAKAETQAAEANVAAARLNLSFTEVRSPIDGRAGRASVTVGNLVSTQPNATLLTTVVSLDPVYVEFAGDEQTYLRYVEMVRSGERVSSRVSRTPVRIAIGVDGNFNRDGYVDFVANTLDASTGTIKARAVVANPDHTLIPGMFARVQFMVRTVAHAFLIDDKAILTDQDRKYVLIVDADNHAQRRDISIDRLADGLRIVTKGLSGSDRIIVSGAQKVFLPGMTVKPNLVPMPAPAAATPGPAGGAG